MDAKFVVEQIVELFKAGVWPLVVITLVCFLHKELKRAADAIVNRIGEAAELKVGPAGIELKAMEGVAKSSQLAQRSLSAAVESLAKEHAAGAVTAVAPGASEVVRLADEYDMGIRIADYRKRVARKDELADAIGAAIVKEGFNRETLSKEDNEGFRVGLASVINAAPRVGDLHLLLRIASTARTKHTKFRIVLALISLISSGLATDEHADEISAIINAAHIDADGPLEALLGQCIALLRSRFPNSTWPRWRISL